MGLKHLIALVVTVGFLLQGCITITYMENISVIDPYIVLDYDQINTTTCDPPEGLTTTYSGTSGD